MNAPHSPDTQPSKDNELLGLKLVAIAMVAVIGLVVISSAIRIPTALTANDPFRHMSSGSPPAAAATTTAAPVAPTTVAPEAAASTSAAPAASSPAAASASAPAAGAVAAAPAGAVQKVGFKPPTESEMPEGPLGDVIRQGEQIFLHTGQYAKAYVGNTLNCVNCHLDAGRQADSAPLWGAYLLYPAYRAKTKHVDTFEDRLRGCFMYSMNGKAPPYGDEVLNALQTYAYWLAKGAPVGEKIAGAGYRKLDKPAQAPDYQRGLAVYKAKCALCHGAQGEGTRAGDTQVFPPLWGPQSYNWGAGMVNVPNAAAFIKSNMPFSQGGSLSDQEAWDVAQYIDSHDRPQDPRFTGDVEATRQQFHEGSGSLYGQTVNGKLLGRNTK